MKKLGFGLLLLMTSMVSFAEDSAKQLLAILTPLQTMQAQFEQAIVAKNGKVLEKTSGTMALLRPGKFRWETEKPSHQLLIADGKKIWLYDESLKQATVQPQVKKTTSPVMLLSDPTSSLTEQFNIHSSKPEGKTQTFTLVPKNKADMFQKIGLTFTDNQLNQMQLFDHLGQRTIIKFQAVKVNTPINTGFEFVAPKGVDIVAGE
jgi:outer membrane lipoprotein carrier protein